MENVEAPIRKKRNGAELFTSYGYSREFCPASLVDFTGFYRPAPARAVAAPCKVPVAALSSPGAG